MAGFWDSELFQTAETYQPFTLLPAGKYQVALVNATVKQTKNGDGYGINCEFEVVKPEAHAGAKVFTFLNFHNASRKATEIGLGQIHMLAQVGNALTWWEKCKQVTSLEQAIKYMGTLHTALAGKQFIIAVALEKSTYNGQERESNKVTSFFALANTTTAPDPDDIPF